MEESPLPAKEALFPIALAVEGGMGLLAVALGWALDCPPGDVAEWDPAALAWGLAAAVPLLVLMALCVWAPWRPLVDFVRTVDETVVPLFRSCSTADLALIAALAGLGEEMLFRGVLQQALIGESSTELRTWMGIVAVGLIFGMAHSITRTYAALAAVIGVYLGWLMEATGNLLVPIVAHAAYDFLALVYLVRVRRPAAQDAP